MSYVALITALKGGSGSGNHGHAGRPGKRGGSASKSGVGAAAINSAIKAPVDAEISIDIDAYASYIAGLPNPSAAYEDVYTAGGWDHAIRSETKDNICNALSDSTGLSYEAVNKAIRKWATTSNDSNTFSLSMQAAAARVFGTELSDWQKMKYNELAKLQGEDTFKSLSAFATDHHPYPTAQAAQDAFLKAMYQHTQSWFAKQGVKTVTLYRGSKPENSEENSLLAGDVVNMKSNAMESWTVHPLVSKEFGYMILKAEIPVERILSTARTGYGCLNEYEYVALGGVNGDSAIVVKDVKR